MQLSWLHVVGLGATIALIIGIGVWSGRKVSSAADFSSGGGKAGPWIVCGAIMGTLVSGQATIGTAQLAFSFGLSAWWFTLGSGIGLILAIGYAAPLRRSGVQHLLQIVSPGVRPPGGDLWQHLLLCGHFHQRRGPDPLGHGPADHHLSPGASARRPHLHPAHGDLRHLRRRVGGRYGRGSQAHPALWGLSGGRHPVHDTWPGASAG